MNQKEGKILVVDDNEQILRTVKQLLKYECAEVKTTKNPNTLPNILANDSYDVILLDMNFQAGVNTGNEGLFWLNEILKIDPKMTVILITAYGDIDLAVKAVKQGATDFIQKPWDPEKMITTVLNAIKLKKTEQKIEKLQAREEQIIQDQNKTLTNFIGTSPVMIHLFSTIKKVAKTDANILILGENGTGKELAAREIHRLSQRSSELFMTVDMASMSESLIESELFGYVEGAFTDAKSDRMGRMESASGGTLFLDEIGNIPLSIQTKLLTALQNRKIFRVGSTKEIDIDIRLICATNKNLEKLIEDGLFREDLYYRINTIQLELPPLNQRGDDIITIANHYLNEFSSKYDKPGLKINKNAFELLRNYHWKGNVRELKHTIEKAVILTENKVLTIEDFNQNKNKSKATSIEESNRLEDVEKQTIIKVLEKHKGNLTKAAKELDISRTTLYLKINKYEIQ